MTDIVLVQPPIRDFYLTRKRTFPYGLSRIAACLRSAGFDVVILDGLATDKCRILPTPQVLKEAADLYGPPDTSPFGLFGGFRHFGFSFEHLAEQVRKHHPWLVGVSSLFTAYSAEALFLAKTIKKIHPNCKIVLGGHHPTAFPHDVLQEPAVDFVIRGDGEEAMAALACRLKTGQPLEDVPGLALRNSDGIPIASELAVVRNLDSLPLPAIDLVRLDRYSRRNRPALVVAASRGCPMTCSYCCFGGDSPVAYRRMSWHRVMHEIEAALSRYDVGFIDFEDEHLSLDRDGMIGFLRDFRRKYGNRRIELRAMNGLYPPSLDPELVGEMRNAGFRTLNLSLGSTDPVQMKRFSRPLVLDAFDRCLHEAAVCGMEAVGYILIAAPDQTADTSLSDLLALAQRRVLIGASVFYPAPGSRDHRWCADQGLLPSDRAAYRSTAIPLSHRTTRLQTVTLMRIARMINFIKRLLDAGVHPTQPDSAIHSSELSARERNGARLLQLFLSDGRIRGIDREGNVFFHPIDEDLAEAFRKEIPTTRFRGVLQ
ncbi:MAG: radical SAM protein [Thermodesulfobacteriota bacterium]